MVMTDTEHPETLFTAAGQHRVAIPDIGCGSAHVVMSPGLWSHMELIREDPGHVNFRGRMQSFSRYIGFDSLGTGLSDRPPGGSAVQYWIDSCAAVLDATCAPAPVIVSVFSSGPLVLQFVTPVIRSVVLGWSSSIRTRVGRPVPATPLERRLRRSPKRGVPG